MTRFLPTQRQWWSDQREVGVPAPGLPGQMAARPPWEWGDLSGASPVLPTSAPEPGAIPWAGGTRENLETQSPFTAECPCLVVGGSAVCSKSEVGPGWVQPCERSDHLHRDRFRNSFLAWSSLLTKCRYLEHLKKLKNTTVKTFFNFESRLDTHVGPQNCFLPLPLPPELLLIFWLIFIGPHRGHFGQPWSLWDGNVSCDGGNTGHVHTLLGCKLHLWGLHHPCRWLASLPDFKVATYSQHRRTLLVISLLLYIHFIPKNVWVNLQRHTYTRTQKKTWMNGG